MSSVLYGNKFLLLLMISFLSYFTFLFIYNILNINMGRKIKLNKNLLMYCFNATIKPYILFQVIVHIPLPIRCHKNYFFFCFIILTFGKKKKETIKVSNFFTIKKKITKKKAIRKTFKKWLNKFIYLYNLYKKQ